MITLYSLLRVEVMSHEFDTSQTRSVQSLCLVNNILSILNNASLPRKPLILLTDSLDNMSLSPSNINKHSPRSIPVQLIPDPGVVVYTLCRHHLLRGIHSTHKRPHPLWILSEDIPVALVELTIGETVGVVGEGLGFTKAGFDKVLGHMDVGKVILVEAGRD